MASFNQHSQQSFISNPINKKDEEKTDDYNKTLEKHREIVESTPPKEGDWFTKQLVKYQGVWLNSTATLKGVMAVQQHFKAQPTDTLLATFPKSGTTWFKAARSFTFFRNPKDVFVSNWFFLKKLRPELPSLSIQEAFKLFRQGVTQFGPFWDHVLGNWNASRVSPEKVLFLTYEDMKIEPFVHVKRLAEFLGHPFFLGRREGRGCGGNYKAMQFREFEQFGDE
ncbi:cytosolic sulfotransferase 18-like [Cornus florida]|uniref:cytosolic sulfotransferase 18-like n=1 Tax=Cornus florida TaxID=4283 RepID=UPI00289AD477|nr:cytosolic sulfotransferase 18-like [Cornus florida]